MSAGRERSRGGCWTCKARKKKCDEARPVCSTCQSLDIDCYGYGPKPSWWDGGKLEREQIDRFREKVKSSTSRKRQHRHLSIPASPLWTGTRDSAVSVGASETYTSSPFAHSGTEFSLQESCVTSHVEVLPPSGNGKSSTGEQNHAVEGYEIWGLPKKQVLRTNDDDAGLLMHYLDYVFPLQFPFYNHCATSGGRGWLLSLLLKVEPLYQAALSVASYHQHFKTYSVQFFGPSQQNTTGNLPVCDKLEEQLNRYLLSLQVLRQYVDEMQESDLSLKQQIEVHASITLLISLEVFQGESSNWEKHLKAGVKLLAAIVETFATADLPQTHRDIFRFFAIALHWYDLQSCTATGTLPMMESPGRAYDLCFQPIRQFTGCSDLITHQQLRVIQLYDWKQKAKAKKQLSILELASRAKDIEDALWREFNNMADGSSAFITVQGKSGSGFVATMISSIYIYATLVYLHVVVSGAHPELPEIHDNVARAIMAFRELPECEWMHYLSWPLCIAGCMATKEQQNMFRDIAAKMDISRFPFGSTGHAVRIMEECWKLREVDAGTEPACWYSAMNSLGLKILLV